MKHVNICSDYIKDVKHYPNLSSLNYEAMGGDIPEIKTKLPELKKLIVSDYNEENSIYALKGYSYQIKVLEVHGLDVTIINVTKYCNSNKLKSLTINSGMYLYLDGLDIIKSKFNVMKLLELKGYEGIVSLIDFNLSINFISNLDIELKGVNLITLTLAILGI